MRRKDAAGNPPVRHASERDVAVLLRGVPIALGFELAQRRDDLRARLPRTDDLVQEQLGRGVAQSDLLAPGRPLAEGVATAPALVSRARKEGVELPIAEAVADLLAGLPAGDALLRLMGRPLKEE